MASEELKNTAIGTVMMARYITQEGPRDEMLRTRAIQHWQRSLELKPIQPKLAAMVERYTKPATDKAAGQARR